MSLILSYLCFDVVNTRDNDEQKGSKNTHSSPTVCLTLDAGHVWGSIKQRSKTKKDGLHELRLKAVSVIIRPRMKAKRRPFVSARAQSSELGGVSWFRSPAASGVPDRVSRMMLPAASRLNQAL